MPTLNGTKVSVYGGQTFKKALLPPTKYIKDLLKAYCPEITFDAAAFHSAFHKARTDDFDAAFAAVTPDGSCRGLQLCWCLLDIPAGSVLPMHAHKNCEVTFTLRGCMRERAVANATIPSERLAGQEIDWLTDSTDAKIEERSYPVGSVSLNVPGSIHQVYTDKSEGCLLLILYSKDCTFIRATDPTIARQLLPATPDKGTAYHLQPICRTPSSFSARDPCYARFRASLNSRLQHPQVNVAQVVVKALADCGVRDAILYPGAKCIELLKVVDNNNYGVRGWLCRNEHAGAFMAEGYNKAQGDRLCAIMTTSGPGATNLCTGIASAWRDAVPMVVITSQVPTYKTGTAAFQEVPVTEIFRPITKGAFAISCASQAYSTIVAACRLAVTGLNGPVLVDIPEDLQAELVSLPEPKLRSLALSGPTSDIRPDPSGSSGLSGPSGPATQPLQGHSAGWLAAEPVGLRSHMPSPIKQSVMKEVMRHIQAARRPLLLLGGGCVRVDEALLNELVDVLGMPVVYTFMGKGCISDDHDLCLGPIGVHGLYTANTAVARCDMVLALGCRFDERAACKSFDLWQAPKSVVHVDIMPQKAMSGSPKNSIACSVVADVEDFVGVLLQHLYGFIEERYRTLSVPLGSKCFDEIQELSAFVVDEEDMQVLAASAARGQRDGLANGNDPQPSAAAATHGNKLVPHEAEDSQAKNQDETVTSFAFHAQPLDNNSNGTSAANGNTVANGSSAHAATETSKASLTAAVAPAANGAHTPATSSPFAAEAANGVASSPVAPVAGRGASMASIGTFSQGEWHTYVEWAHEMSEMKARRWRSLMPCLSAKSELTTREMVHLLDSFLSSHGLQPTVCSDVGSHQCLLAQYLRLHHPRQWLMEGGLASMGCGLPAAIGAALANPQMTCLAVAGDGGFAMTSQELMMAKVYKLNVKVIVTVNNRLQLVEQLEEETFDSLDVFTFLGDPDHPNRPYPHFSKLAEAYGVPAVTAWNKQELLDGLSMMFSRPGPFLLEVVALAERPHIKYWDSSEQ